MAEYEVYFSLLRLDDSGDPRSGWGRLAGPVPFQRLEWSVVLNDIGVCYLEASAADAGAARGPRGAGRELRDLLQPDLLLEVWRSAPTGRLALAGLYIVRDFGCFSASTLTADRETAWWRGYDLNYLLAGRTVAAAAGSAGAAKAGPAAAVMAAYADEALVTTTAARALPAEYDLTLDYQATAGPAIAYTASRGNLLGVLQGCAATAGAQGAPMRFRVVGDNRSGVLVITPRPFGTDRTAEQPFSLEAGTLFDAAWEYRGGAAVNYAYVGGRGEGAERLVAEVSTGAATPFTRREMWAENSQIELEASLENWGQARLWERRAREVFTAELRDTELTTLGRDWDLGDLVTAEYRGRLWSAEVAALQGRCTDQGDYVSATLTAEGLVEETA